MTSLCHAFSGMSTILTLSLLVHGRRLSLFLSVILPQYDIRISCGGEHGYCSFPNLWHRLVRYQWKWDVSERFLSTYQTTQLHVPEEFTAIRTGLMFCCFIFILAFQTSCYAALHDWMIFNVIVVCYITCDGHVCWLQVGAPDPYSRCWYSAAANPLFKPTPACKRHMAGWLSEYDPVLSVMIRMPYRVDSNLGP